MHTCYVHLHGLEACPYCDCETLHSLASWALTALGKLRTLARTKLVTLARHNLASCALTAHANTYTQACVPFT